jgi:hypothetical protein
MLSWLKQFWWVFVVAALALAWHFGWLPLPL